MKILNVAMVADNVGDVEFAAAAECSSAITPVPGALGP